MTIPIPKQVTPGGEPIRLTGLMLDTTFSETAEGIRALLPELSEGAPGPAARFCLDASLEQEAYRLACGADGAQIEAGGALGALRAAATIAQLLLVHGGVPAGCDIADEPRFSWRGLSLDVTRHFFPISTIERLLDLMALYKLNRLHLHLSDDQGFRFESERFPLLTGIGSRRKSTLIRRNGREEQDGVPHGGFYTKGELRALVRYAKARGVEIAPEIDMPGHALAMLAAYPELACFPAPTEVATRFGITDFSSRLLCAGRTEVFDFLTALLDEVIEVFPFPYVHLGGDEAIKTEWARCPRCQAAMKQHGLRDERALQGWFLNKVAGHLASRGRRAIVWNDGLDDALTADAVCQHWMGLSGGTARTKRWIEAGKQAIFSDFWHIYFDYPYAATPLEKTYRYEPALRGMRGAEGALGMECALWTEWIDGEEKLFFNLLPRLAAFAETAWSPKDARSYGGFLRRLKPHYTLYEKLGLPYARGVERRASLWKRLRAAATFLTRDTHAELKARETPGGEES